MNCSLALTCVLLTVGAPSKRERRPIRFEGAVVLAEEVYRSVLELAEEATRPNLRSAATEAKFIKEHLTGFLVASGYVLAKVDVQPEGKGLIVRIDEGRLERVVFLDQGTFDLIKLTLQLDLPGKVFNQPLVERRLEEIVRDTRAVAYSYELVPVTLVKHSGPQIVGEPSSVLRGLDLLTPGESHELRVRLQRTSFDEGFDVGFGYRPPDGLFFKAYHRAGSVLLPTDRTRAGGQVAIRLADAVTGQGDRLGLSKLEGEIVWLSPPLASQTLRAMVTLRASMLGRTRQDLNLSRYFQSPLLASAGVELEPTRRLAVRASVGLEPRFVFGEKAIDDSLPVPDPVPDRFRGFAQLDGALVLNPNELRADRPHDLRLAVRAYSKASGEARHLIHARGDYRVMVELGYDELRLSLAGALRFGVVPYFDEVALGDGMMRVAFTGDRYSRRLTGGTLEYRVSLWRDYFKVSVFGSGVLFEELEGLDRAAAGLQGAVESGIGLHALVYDAFQGSIYTGLGLDGAGDLDFGVSLSIERAF